MEHIWTFSSSSEAILKRCLDASTSKNSNKWVLAFSKKRQKIDTSGANNDEIPIDNKTEDNFAQSKPIEDIKNQNIHLEIEDSLFEVLEADNVNQFNEIVEKSAKKPEILTAIAQRLSPTAIEKICNHLYTKSDINNEFLDRFYMYFFPAYLKRDLNWLSLDLFVKSYEIHPLQFKKLLVIVLKDKEIPKKLLQDFIETLNEQKKFSFMNFLIQMEMNREEFVQNLFMIYSLYKDCKKTEEIQKYILLNLLEHYEGCEGDRNYGRLCLAFLQAQKNMGVLDDADKIEKILEKHRTPFKKPCMNILKSFEHNTGIDYN